MPKYKVRRAVYINAQKDAQKLIETIATSVTFTSTQHSENSANTNNVQSSAGGGDCSLNYAEMESAPTTSSKTNYALDHVGIDTSINNFSESDNFIESESDNYSDENEEVPKISFTNAADSATDKNTNLTSSLSEWACKFKVPHNALDALLLILKDCDPSLPSSSRTLLKTPRQLCFTDIIPGQYYHFGIVNALNNLLSARGKSVYGKINCVEITINIDGLPISQSSSAQLYPILCSLYSYSLVEIVGLYYGLSKPKDANVFLNQLIEEATYLTNNGYSYNGNNYSFKIAAFICDVPAKSFIMFLKGHTGYHSCSKCYIEGTFKQNKVCFPETDGLRMRTDADFREKIDEPHHTGTSIIELLPGIDMIQDVPLDYMHLICLGVMRKLILLWLSGKPPNKLPHLKICDLSNLLVNIANCIPIEFVRKPRSLNEVKRFKATEFRQFLCYTGPVVLKPVLLKNMYVNFLCLHVAVRILSSSYLLQQYMEYARSLLNYFVKTFITLYGKENVSHNVHNLIHLCDDALRFGILQNFCSFPFENYLQQLKKLIRKKDQPLAQIVKRIMEQSQSRSKNSGKPVYSDEYVPKYSHNNGPLVNNEQCTQYKQIYMKDYILKIMEPNNCCSLQNQLIVNIENIIGIGENLFTIDSFYDAKNKSIRATKTSDLESDSSQSTAFSSTKRKIFKKKFEQFSFEVGDSDEDISALPKPPSLHQAKRSENKSIPSSSGKSSADVSHIHVHSIASTITNPTNININSPSTSTSGDYLFEVPPTLRKTEHKNLFKNVQATTGLISKTPSRSNNLTGLVPTNEVVLEYLKKIVVKQNLLQGMLSDVMSELDYIKLKLNKNEDPEDVTTSIFFELGYLPITQMVDLDHFEAFLAEDSNMKKSVLEVSKYGGNNIYDFIFRTAGRLITNKFAGANYSYLGRKGKKCFQQLKLASLLLRAAQKLIPEPTNKQVETEIAKWLRRCGERGKKEL